MLEYRGVEFYPCFVWREMAAFTRMIRRLTSKEKDMSLETWIAEFYPRSAREVTKKAALAHSLRKWVGLMPENLKRHGVTLLDRYVVDQGASPFCIGSDTCALCYWYWDEEMNACPKCPLQAFTDGAACWGQYRALLGKGDVSPMLSLLRRAIEAQRVAPAKRRSKRCGSR